jgi:phosphoribosyl 1,2-cyclic phosphodiesterase
LELGTSENSAPIKGADEEASPQVAVRCWGARGSIPSPGPATAGYGGNTTCVEVQAGESRIIFDAGTGIRLLGNKLMEEGATKACIFLTHFHWDHIQGFPFFEPVYNPEFDLKIVGPEQDGMDVETLFAGQMGPVYFPIPYEALSANLTFDHLNEGVWEQDGIRMRAMRMRHPSYTVGYRVEAFGRSVVFIPDNELVGGTFPTPPKWREKLNEFVAGADVMFHDAMFTQEEYPRREGWGHSTFTQTLELAEQAGVKKVFFFHHAPERSDAELNQILDTYRTEVGERGLDLGVHAAFEGKQVLIEEA